MSIPNNPHNPLPPGFRDTTELRLEKIDNDELRIEEEKESISGEKNLFAYLKDQNIDFSSISDLDGQFVKGENQAIVLGTYISKYDKTSEKSIKVRDPDTNTLKKLKPGQDVRFYSQITWTFKVNGESKTYTEYVDVTRGLPYETLVGRTKEDLTQQNEIKKRALLIAKIRLQATKEMLKEPQKNDAIISNFAKFNIIAYRNVGSLNKVALGQRKISVVIGSHELFVPITKLDGGKFWEYIHPINTSTPSQSQYQVSFKGFDQTPSPENMIAKEVESKNGDDLMSSIEEDATKINSYTSHFQQRLTHFKEKIQDTAVFFTKPETISQWKASLVRLESKYAKSLKARIAQDVFGFVVGGTLPGLLVSELIHWGFRKHASTESFQKKEKLAADLEEEKKAEQFSQRQKVKPSFFQKLRRGHSQYPIGFKEVTEEAINNYNLKKESYQSTKVRYQGATNQLSPQEENPYEQQFKLAEQEFLVAREQLEENLNLAQYAFNSVWGNQNNSIQEGVRQDISKLEPIIQKITLRVLKTDLIGEDRSQIESVVDLLVKEERHQTEQMESKKAIMWAALTALYEDNNFDTNWRSHLDSLGDFQQLFHKVMHHPNLSRQKLQESGEAGLIRAYHELREFQDGMNEHKSWIEEKLEKLKVNTSHTLSVQINPSEIIEENVQESESISSIPNEEKFQNIKKAAEGLFRNPLLESFKSNINPKERVVEIVSDEENINKENEFEELEKQFKSLSDINLDEVNEELKINNNELNDLLSYESEEPRVVEINSDTERQYYKLLKENENGLNELNEELNDLFDSRLTRKTEYSDEETNVKSIFDDDSEEEALSGPRDRNLNRSTDPDFEEEEKDKNL
ncbi:MAG: hypothetical protein Tsb0021_07920 [Chlamydiales bacterium]